MIAYTKKPNHYIKGKNREIPSFLGGGGFENIDWNTVDSFGEEWERFNDFSEREIQKVGHEYFDVVPEELFKKSIKVLDVGCGTGRWTYFIADKVGFVDAIDPSKAIISADELLKDKANIRISQASVDNIPFPDSSYDLVFSLGVLHHIPDTLEAMRKCVKKVKPEGYFLVYLYYNLDNRGIFFKLLFKFSNLLRKIISRFPTRIKNATTDIIAVLGYLPLILLSRIVEKIPGVKKWVTKIPLSYYRNKSFNIIRNDSLDRFGTPLEHRFSKVQVEKMMKDCGLNNIVFSPNEPYWHAIGKKSF